MPSAQSSISPRAQHIGIYACVGTTTTTTAATTTTTAATAVVAVAAAAAAAAVAVVVVVVLQGGHGTGKTGNLVLTFSRQGKHREFAKKY